MMAVGLDGLATVALERDELSRGARLAAASAQLRASIGGGSTLEIAGLEPALDHARRLMDPIDFEQAAAEGRALTIEQVVSEAIGAVPADDQLRGGPPTRHGHA
jgi:hypothetical protein